MSYRTFSLSLITAVILLSGCVDTAAEQSELHRDLPFEVVLERVESEEHDFRLVRILDGLDRPWSLDWLPDGRILLTERSGRLILYDGERRVDVGNVPEVHARGQGGLLDVQLHPDYSTTGWIYLSYSAACGEGLSATAIDRARLDGETLVDRENIYTQSPCVSPGRHYGSRIVFPGDGTILFSIGDRGQQDRAQDPSDPAGSVIRINEDGGIPADNPFVDQDGAAQEIFTYGNRNIQGMTIDLRTGNVWATEHGPQGGDELNLIEAGNNYGWPAITYGVQYRTGERIGGEEADGMEQPVVYWTPSIATSGLAMYDADAFPSWKGNLFAGALAFEQIRRIVLDGTEVTHQEVLLENEVGRIRDVRQGPDGYVYLLTDENPGGLYRIEPLNQE